MFEVFSSYTCGSWLPYWNFHDLRKFSWVDYRLHWGLQGDWEARQKEWWFCSGLVWFLSGVPSMVVALRTPDLIQSSQVLGCRWSHESLFTGELNKVK